MVFLWSTLLWLLLAVPLLVALYAWLLHRRKQQFALAALTSRPENRKKLCFIGCDAFVSF